MTDSDQIIDAVITWVDGNDPEHRRKRLGVLSNPTAPNPETNTASGTIPTGNTASGTTPTDDTASGTISGTIPTGNDPTRFIDNNELYYCIQSIRTFAPWIRTIHVVTDNQTPSFLTPETRKRLNVRIVDHTEIFASCEWALPTFNSRTIETALWRIPDLAPRFIYFNDDYVLTANVTPDDFFVDGKVVLRGKWNRMTRYGPVRMGLNNLATFAARRLLGITRSMTLLLQIRSAQLAGCTKRYFRTPHVPQPVRTDTLRAFFEQHPSTFEQNIRYRTRNIAQFNGIYLANHLEINNHNAVLEKAGDYLMLNGEQDPGFVLRRKLRKIAGGEVRFVCLHGMEKFRQRDRERILEVIRSKLRNSVDAV